MRFASLGSGSRGNAMVIESGSTRVLLDCGFSVRETVKRLERLAVSPESLSAILVTHEHGDHVAGVFKLARRYAIPVWLTYGTMMAVRAEDRVSVQVEVLDGLAVHALGDLAIRPYPVPHDAREPVQFVFSDGSGRLGVLTDTGSLTTHMLDVLTACDALVLECNHDREMLACSDYPVVLKNRISGRLGHLDNDTAAALLKQIDVSRLQHIVAAHLSEQNNCAELARAAIAGALNCETHWVGVAGQQEGFDWRQIR